MTAQLGLMLNPVSGFATLIWAPTGLAIAATLLFGYEMWPAIFLGAFLVNHFSQGGSIPVAFMIGIGNTLEAIIAVYFLRKFEFKNSVRSVKDAINFIFFGALIPSLVSATIGVGSLFISQIVTTNTFGITWFTWWTGDVLGALVVVPFAILIFKKRSERKQFIPYRFIESILFFVLFSILCYVIFFDPFSLITPTVRISYIIFPFVVIAIFRYGEWGEAIAVIITSTIAITGTVLNRGPFSFSTQIWDLFSVQVFVGTLVVAKLIILGALIEREKGKEEIEVTKEKDEAMLRNMGEGVVAIDTSGNIVLLNNAAALMLHISEKDVIGLKYTSIFSLEDDMGNKIEWNERPVRFATEYGTVSKATVMTGPTYYYVRNDGTKFPASFVVSPIIVGNTLIGAVNVFSDISYEKEIDKAKSEFVSTVSHQLRSPLTNIKWSLDTVLLKETGSLNDTQEKYIKSIYGSVERMIGLLNALLNVSKIELGTYKFEFEQIHVEQISDEALIDLESTITLKGITIHKEYSENLPVIDSNKKFLMVVFQNLFSNAIKYSPDNSKINVDIHEEKGNIIFSIENVGHGISLSDQKNIFNKFFRTSEAKAVDTTGIGLGLYITKSFIEKLGGKIWFESVPDAKTIFYISLPIAHAKT